MNAIFQDHQDKHNGLNGMPIRSEGDLEVLLDSFAGREPFFFELTGENGFALLVGIGVDACCVQYGKSDGDPPYAMATNGMTEENEPFGVFLTGNTPTEVPRRFCIALSTARQIIVDFLMKGERSPAVEWQNI